MELRKQMTAAVISFCLAVLLTVSLVGCSGNNKSDMIKESQSEENVSEAMNEEETSHEEKNAETGEGTETAPPVVNLEESEVWVLYHDGSYGEVLVHAPEGQITMRLCLKDGTSLETEGEPLIFGTRKLLPGWSLKVTNKLPEGYAIDDLAFEITWEDNGEKILIKDFGKERTEEELQNSGFVVLDGRYGTMLDARTTFGSGSSTELDKPSFGLFFEMYFYGKDWAGSLKDMEGLTDQLAFYAGDGTPLEQYFDGFDSIAVEVGDASIYALIYQSSGASYDEAQYKEMCNELRACEPYMTFTGKDDVVQQFTLFGD